MRCPVGFYQTLPKTPHVDRIAAAPVACPFTLNGIAMTPAVTKAKAYLKVRHKAVRDAMKELNVDGMLLTHPPDFSYLTNFTGEDSIGLVTGKDIFMVTDFRYQEQAQIEAGWVKLAVRNGKMADTLAKTIADSGARRVGFEANYATF